MTKYFTYFHLNRGLSSAMRERIKIEKRNGLTPLVLKSTVVSFSTKRVIKHLHEERYQPWFERIEKILERESIPVYDLSAPLAEKPALVKAKETTEEPETTEETNTVFLDTRPRRAADAPIVVYLSAPAPTLNTLVEILSSNEIYVPATLSVNDIPEALEIYVKRGLPDNPEGLRGAVTDDLKILNLGLRYAFPVVWLGDTLPASYDGLYATELNANFLRLSVGSAEARKAALESNA